MKMTEINDQLLQHYLNKEKSWARILSRLKRQFTDWAAEGLPNLGYNDFKVGYMPLLMNIHPHGTTNNELAKEACVTKQAMSKVVKELIELGYITTEEHDKDKRSSIICLTTKGKNLVLTVRKKIAEVEKEYEKTLGKKKFTEIKEALSQLIEINEKLLRTD